MRSANMPLPTCATCTRLREILIERLEREDRLELAQACYDFLPARARLDIAGWADKDIFSHESRTRA